LRVGQDGRPKKLGEGAVNDKREKVSEAYDCFFSSVEKGNSNLLDFSKPKPTGEV